MNQILKHLGQGDTFRIVGLMNGGGAEGDDVLLRIDSVTRTGHLNCALIFWEQDDETDTNPENSISVSICSINMADFETAVKYEWYVPGSYSWYDEMKADPSS